MGEFTVDVDKGTSVLASAQGFELTVLHTNDVHSRIEEVDTTGGSCSAAEATAGECYGGMARMAAKVREIRHYDDNVLLLDGGDQFQGTPWFTEFHGLASSRFMNKLQYNAMSAGNHDFDNGVAGIVLFLLNVTFPVLACNIDASREPTMQGLILPSVVLDIGEEKVGIVGYITKNTPVFSPTGNLVFLDEVESVQAEVTKLLGQGVNKIIALGHAGYSKDQDVARRVSGVDAVVGGHTNTFLYTGAPPSSEVPLGPYPLIVHSEVDPGRQVPVVQAYAYGKYLGYLRLTFDGRGDLVRWSGNPILLDNSVPKDPDVLEMVTDLKERLNHTKEVIGRTNVFLQGVYETCTVMECNMGNLITDAMVHQNIKYPDEMNWNDVAIAVYNSDSIRASMRIDGVSNLTGQTITTGDLAYDLLPTMLGREFGSDREATFGNMCLIDIESVLFTLPFGNTFDIVELRGEHLYEAFEHSGSRWSSGEFLQVSGILVKYDLTKPRGSRVVSLEARCTRCDVPEFTPVRTDAVYKEDLERLSQWFAVNSLSVNGEQDLQKLQRMQNRAGRLLLGAPHRTPSAEVRTRLGWKDIKSIHRDQKSLLTFKSLNNCLPAYMRELFTYCSDRALILPSHLANGERGYSMISDNKLSHHIPELLDSDMLVGYIKAMSPITTGLDRRITFADEAPPCASGGTTSVLNMGFVMKLKSVSRDEKIPRNITSEYIRETGRAVKRSAIRLVQATWDAWAKIASPLILLSPLQPPRNPRHTAWEFFYTRPLAQDTGTAPYTAPRPEEVCRIAHDLASLTSTITEIPSVHAVIVGEPIWRSKLPPYMPNFHDRLQEFRETLCPLIDSIPKATTWRHCKLWQKNPNYFVADGLHLSDFGQLRYYKSVRWAILPHMPTR
ncbi:5'-nucleotidase [Branchiostoma belcheri]|nr:5'-nucleotidase [Branchiostoma belcheri]